MKKTSFEDTQFSRQIPLYKPAGMRLLKEAHVLVIGLGGVGSHAVEALARSGVGHLTIIDMDTVSKTNINRLLIALHSTVGQEKAKLLKSRIKDINPKCHVRALTLRYDETVREKVFDRAYDYVFDATDTRRAKLDIITAAIKRNIPVITSAGLGNRIDPTKVRIMNLFDLEGDPLARKLKNALRKLAIKNHVLTVASIETPLKRKHVAVPSSTSFVPPVGGIMAASRIVNTITRSESMKQITFAGGCFWGVEAYFKQLDGVMDTRVGYADGNKENPTYEEVCQGAGHTEAVEITYDEEILPLRTLLKHFLTIIDPTLINKQGPDVGIQYRSGIYRYNQSEEPVIDHVMKEESKRYDKPLRVAVKKDTPFFAGEDYHQDYLDKHPGGHCHIDLSLKDKIEE
jgi:peptide-methionine (S)-S-oxide reductase